MVRSQGWGLGSSSRPGPWQDVKITISSGVGWGGGRWVGSCGDTEDQGRGRGKVPRAVRRCQRAAGHQLGGQWLGLALCRGMRALGVWAGPLLGVRESSGGVGEWKRSTTAPQPRAPRGAQLLATEIPEQRPVLTSPVYAAVAPTPREKAHPPPGSTLMPEHRASRWEALSSASSLGSTRLPRDDNSGCGCSAKGKHLN